MDERALFAGFWERESATTRRVLERIPEGSTYRRDPTSRTAQEIAWQIWARAARARLDAMIRGAHNIQGTTPLAAWDR